MNLTPMVSVVMITYGHENYIEQAIDGVLMQECGFDVEFIIANDCSPDKTDNIIQDILKKDSRSSIIKYYKHNENLGMMLNFIDALKQCKGKYIALCEGDDYWTDPLKLKKQVDFLEENADVIICGTNYNIQRGKELITNNHYVKINRFNHFEIFTNTRISTLTSLFRNNFKIPSYLERCKFGDMSLWLILIKGSDKLAVLPINTAVYRVHNQGVFSGETTLQNIKNGFNDRMLFFKYNGITFKYMFYLLRRYITRGFWQLLRALLFRPDSDFRLSFIYFWMIYKLLLKYFKFN